MNRIHIIILAATLLFASCGKKPVFDEQRTFAGDNWQRFNPEIFDVTIHNIDDSYHLIVDIEVDTALFRLPMLPLAININGPDGSNRMFYGHVMVRENDRWQGEMSDGYLHSSQRVRQYLFFNTAGVHQVVMNHATSHYDLRGIKSLRFRVEKAELNYPK